VYSDTLTFKGVRVCVAITNCHDRPCGAQQEKIIMVQREKIISVQQAKKANGLRAQRVEAMCCVRLGNQERESSRTGILRPRKALDVHIVPVREYLSPTKLSRMVLFPNGNIY